MKTTVEIPDALYREAKLYAAQQGISAGIRARTSNYPAVTTKGNGLAVNGDWGTIRSIIYEGHGG